MDYLQSLFICILAHTHARTTAVSRRNNENRFIRSEQVRNQKWAVKLIVDDESLSAAGKKYSALRGVKDIYLLYFNTHSYA